MTRILVTNDDEVYAPGIGAGTGDAGDRRGGSVRASGQPERQRPQENAVFGYPGQQGHAGRRTPAYAVGGSPADCVALLSLGMSVHWPPDIVVSGINRGANMGQDITYSGTVTAALEAAIDGVKAVAVSLDNHEANTLEDYAVAARVAQTVVREALKRPLPPLTILNLNVPKGEVVKGVRLVRQGVRIYWDELGRNADDTAYRIVGPVPGGVYDTVGTDVWALHLGYASLTPIHLDMTAHQFMAELAAWDVTI